MSPPHSPTSSTTPAPASNGASTPPHGIPDSYRAPLSLGFEALPGDKRTHEDLIVAMESCVMTFLAAPICSEREPATLANQSLEQLQSPLEYDSLAIRSPDYISATVPTIEHHFNETSIKNQELRLKANLHLKRLFNWVGHLAAPSILLSLPTCPSVIPEFARALNAALPLVPYSTIWIRAPLAEESWPKWNLLRSLMGQSVKLHLALVVGPDLPMGPNENVLANGTHEDLVLVPGSSHTMEPAWARWLAEPVASLILPADSFLTNKKGFPVLSKRHQQLVRTFLPREPYVLITPTGTSSSSSSPSSTSLSQADMSKYAEYIKYLHRTLPKTSIRDRFANGYMDYLQAPLQPLMDHLEAQTYDVFERDPVKYRKYTAAVAECLRDRTKTLAAAEMIKPQLVMVVGAGPRGPLVDCVLKGAQQAKVNVKVIAVEKNPNALVSLKRKQKEQWGEALVEVVYADMRQWKPKEKCDILVSELLGSFGDNELSPECLDGVQHVLKDDGVSIPQSYTPYLAPVSSSKLYSEASKLKTPGSLETSYVVMIRNAWLTSPVQPLWTFSHPAPALLPDNLHNERYATVTFDIGAQPALIHGFAGYFECVLYGGVTMSTRPDNHTPDMTSWFPIYFPIRHPMHVPAGSKVGVHVWRVTGAHKVWYEWAMVKPDTMAVPAAGFGSLIHNVGGKSHWIGL
ncbi:PRMT5 arginine-N-methyltransferase-domain-containing protein [Catenaria anguillulae PL171]|uniref:Protein arginine N-methyltransferase n=1 Tax=Catenaria anguillulae PL171 TaxID=765915 RepID=A0A1Y2HNC6_9FUNG|nr:PRMT5 arginine-N-methyltransferase-domain-containing protein [Catenaria anguillulae PL171]